jgi:hypothetical protein
MNPRTSATQEPKSPGKWVRFRSSVLAEIEGLQLLEGRPSFSNMVEKLVGEALSARRRKGVKRRGDAVALEVAG